MNDKVVLLVHGMGTHAKGEMKKTFKKALNDRASASGLDISEILKTVDLVEFNYSEKFDAIRNQFAQNAQARTKGFGYLAGAGFTEDLITQLTNFESNLGKDDFFYTHWLDVVLYGTTYFGEEIRRLFLDLFENNRGRYGHKNMHIVCHSLGTSIVHDSLAKFYREDSDPYDRIPDLPTGSFNVASVWTFANVSRLVNLLNGFADPNSSTFVTGNDGCINDLYNIRNKYDPFTWFKRYDRRMENKTTLGSRIMRQANMHDFYEYVTEPRVARNILFTIYETTFSEDQYNDGLKQHRKGSLNEEVKKIKKRIEELTDDPSIDSLKDAIGHFKSIYELIEQVN